MEVSTCTSGQILKGQSFEITTRGEETFCLVPLRKGKSVYGIGMTIHDRVVLFEDSKGTRVSIVTIKGELVEVGKPLVLVMDGHPEQHESVRSIRRLVPLQQRERQVLPPVSLEDEILAEAKSPVSQ